MATLGMLRLNLLADLQNAPVTSNQVVLVTGKMAMTDGLGGFYRWDPTSTADADMGFMNVIPSNVSSTGRWLRIFQRARNLAQGVLVTTGGVRTLYALGVTDSNGRFTVNLTEENTTTGTALFTEVWQTAGESTGTASTPNDVVLGSRYSLSSDRKILAYQFSRGGMTTLGSTLLNIAGAIIPGLRSVPAGTPVAVRVDGI